MRLKARLNAGFDWYPRLCAIVDKECDVSRSRVRASRMRHVVRYCIAD